MQTPNCKSIKSTRVTIVPVVILAMLLLVDPSLSVTEVGEVPGGVFSELLVDPSPSVMEVGEVPGGDFSEDVNVAGLLVDSFLSVTEVGETSGGDLSEDVNCVVGPSLLVTEVGEVPGGEDVNFAKDENRAVTIN